MNKILTLALLIFGLALIYMLDTIIFKTFNFSILKWLISILVIFNFNKINTYLHTKT